MTIPLYSATQMKELADRAFCIYGEQVRGQVTKADAKMTGSTERWRHSKDGMEDALVMYRTLE